MEDGRIEVTHLMGKKLDKPIIIELGTKTENKNRMEQVAKLFGKKLGEEFVVKDKYKTEFCKFTEHGLLCLDKAFFLWQKSGDGLLHHLLTGRAVIVNE